MDLITKYRPETFDEFFGNESIVRSLGDVLAKDSSHSFLFTGPSGCGKTTLARLVAKTKDVPTRNLIEIDAATYSGADNVRAITETLKYKPFGGQPNRAIIVDECHSLSKQAWQALLKSIEEPPSHVYWCLCTTELNKVPKTIQTRCVHYDLRPLNDNDMFAYLSEVRDAEALKVPDDVLELIVQYADGSPRQALVGLSKLDGVDERGRAGEILSTAVDTKEIVDLCRGLVSMAQRQNFEWAQLQKLLNAVDEGNPESIRVVIRNYVAACISKESRPNVIMGYLRIMEAFDKPFTERDKLAPVWLALGELCYGG